jgi:tetratricopeptide (TPR) repeat protein
LDKVIELNPFNGKAFALIAWCYLRDGSLSKDEWENGIVKNAKFAIDLEKENYEHYNTLGAYYSLINRTDLAIETIERGIKYCRNKYDKVTLYSNLSSDYLLVGNLEKADECIKKSLEITRDFAFTWFKFGCLMQSEGKDSVAVEYFKKAICLPKMENAIQGQLYYYYAISCLNVNESQIAKEYITKALDIEPNSLEYQSLYARINNKL